MTIRKLFITLLCLVIFQSGQSQTIDTLLDVGGYRLHFTIVEGKGVPILFESGNGDDGTVWKDMLTRLHDSIGATLITYDRAGLGRSEIDTSEINLLQEVQGLEVGLKKLGYLNQVFLVCHSFGSYYSTLYALRNTKEVKGCVFIDVLSPCFFTKERARQTKDEISKEDWAMLKKEAIGLYYVLNNLESIYEFTRDKTFPPDIPATIIGADNPPPIVKENERTEWKECLKLFGTLPNHNYVLAKNCGHKVWKDNPELVTNEIVKLYRQVTMSRKEK